MADLEQPRDETRALKEGMMQVVLTGKIPDTWNMSKTRIDSV